MNGIGTEHSFVISVHDSNEDINTDSDLKFKSIENTV